MPRFSKKGLTFEDVLLVPGRPKILPEDVDVSTRLPRHIKRYTPIMSADRDIATESRKASFISIMNAGFIKSNPRDISITEAPNYRVL